MSEVLMSSIASAVKGRLGHRLDLLAGGCLHTLHTLRRAAISANEHDAVNIAQATAYSAMFALFPALIVAAALVSLLPDAFPVRVQMATFFDRVLPSNVSPLLESYFTHSSHGAPAQRALLGSIVVSITGASSVMATLMEGFRRAHKLPLLRGNFWPTRLRALALVPLSLLPMTAASLLVVFGHLITRQVAHDIDPSLRGSVYVAGFLLRWGIALAGSTAIIAVIYHLGTDLTRHMLDHLQPFVREPWHALRRDWSWSASLPGAAIATLLWFLSTLLFGFYVTRFANYSRVYGSLGAAIALMFWLFLIALSVLIGAEFNAQRTVQHRDPAISELLWKLPGLRKRRTGRIAD
jgi:membrane protein